MKKNRRTSRPAPEHSSRITVLIENNSYFLGLSDLKGNITYINTAGRKLCGISSRGSLASMHIVDLFSRSFRPQFEQEILPAIHRTGRWQGSTYLIRRNGRRRLPVEITLTALGTNKSKKLTDLAITIRKKTKCTSVEIERRKSEERLKNLFDETALGIYQTTPAGKILMVNKALYRMLGYRSAEELMKRNLECDGFAPTYSRSRFKKELEKNDILTGLESAWEKADGSFIHVRENSRVVRDEAGKILYYEGTVENITERNRSEEALKLSEEKYRSIVETTTEWIWEMDSQGNHTYSNQRVESILGYPLEEFLKHGAFDFMEPEDQTMVLRKLPGLIESKQGWRNWIIRWRHKNGSIRYLESNATPIIDSQENLLGYRGVDRDITERIRVEEALRASEELFRATFENANVGVCIVSLDGHLLKVNEEMYRMFGYCREELEKMTVNSIAYPEDINISPSFIKKALSEETQHDRFDKRYIHKDGHIICGHVSSSLVHDAHGKPLYFISHVQDITEHKRAEETLRQSEERFRTIFEEGQIGITIAGPDFKFIIANPAFCRMIGYSVEELTRMTFTDITPKNRVGMDAKSIMDLKDGKISQYRTEKQYMKKDGGLFWGNLMSSTIRDNNGNVVSYLAMVEDITDRKNAEEALKDSEERYRRLVEFSPEPVIVHSEGKIVYANPATLTLMGAKQPSDLLGRSVFEMIHPEYRDFVRNRISSDIDNGKTLPVVEEKFLTLDGSTIDVEVAALPIVFEGKPAMQVVVRDITGQKKLQAQLLQAQKMEAIGRLAGGVAHDYNNMIGVILGYASLLEKQIPRTDPSFLKVQSIITAANRTADLTRQLLAFARKQIATPRPLNLNDELIPLQKMIGRLIGEDITLKIRPQQDLWTIRIDPTQIAQILTNLATNARDAIKDTGTISIETSNIIIEQNTLAFGGEIPPGEYAVLIFSDTGTGMDDTVKQQIFEPFFTTKSKEEGTGLGLSTVFGIVNQNDGFITLQSEPEQGTTFTIFFPRFYGEPETPTEIIEDISLAGTETILVVEDEEELMNFVTTVLEIYGYTILSANSPLAAFDICRDSGRTIDLLVTDVVMPDMNGKEFKNQLIAFYPHIKAIFMSGYSADIVAHRGILDEGVNFLQKPFTQRTLALKVREVLDEQ